MCMHFLCLGMQHAHSVYVCRDGRKSRTIMSATNTPPLYETGREIGSSTVTYDEFCHLHIVSIHERSSTKTLRTTRCLKIYSVFKGGNFTNALLKSALHTFYFKFPFSED